MQRPIRLVRMVWCTSRVNTLILRCRITKPWGLTPPALPVIRLTSQLHCIMRQVMRITYRHILTMLQHNQHGARRTFIM